MWEPNQSDLEALIPVLKDSQVPDNTVQLGVRIRIEEMSQYPEFNKYLIYVLTQLTTEDESTRALSGLILKNNIGNLSQDILNYIKQSCLMSIGNSSVIIRGTIGNLITTIISHYGLMNWPEILPILFEMLDSNDFNQLDGSLSALEKICEDSARMVETSISNESFLLLINKILKLFAYQNPKIRCSAIGCINHFIKIRSTGIPVNIDFLMEQLMHLMLDESPTVKKQICICLVMLMEAPLEKFVINLIHIFEYILLQTQDPDENVAQEAVLFWSTFAETGSKYKNLLEPYLNRLIPILFLKLRYPESYIEVDELTQNDENENELEDLFFDWNLRKSCGLALESLSFVYHAQYMTILMPILREALFNDDWVKKESGIYALGVISKGCLNEIVHYLDELIPLFLSFLKDNKMLIRSVACWTLSKYYKFIIYEAHEKYLALSVEALLKLLIDSKKLVQTSACNSLMSLLEFNNSRLEPYLEQILKVMAIAFSKYHRNNTLILYDIVGLLVETYTIILKNPIYLNLVLQPLSEKWNLLKDDDEDLIPLLDCICTIITFLKLDFLPYYEPIFKRCLSIIEKTINEDFVSKEYPQQFGKPEKQNLIVILQLLSASINSFKEHMEPMVTNFHFMHFLHHCMNDDVEVIRKLTSSLLGHITKFCFNLIRPYIKEFIPLLLKNMSPEYETVCNNVTWTIGEIAVKLKERMQPYVSPILRELLKTIELPSTENFLKETTALTIGCLGFACPAEVAPCLNQFLKAFCKTFCAMTDNAKKETILYGICEMIESNPDCLSNGFTSFCEMVTVCSNPPRELHQSIFEIIEAFKNKVGNINWRMFMQQVSYKAVYTLCSNYNI